MQDLSCPDSERLSAYLRQSLPADEALSLSDHIRQCAACRSKVALMSQATEQSAAPEVPGNETSLPLVDTNMLNQAQAGELSMLAELGEYRILEKLGEGGMGTVYKALHTRLDKTVAVKTLTKRFRGDARLVNRFEREMRAAGRVNHPNVVQAYDAREIGGICFLVTEYVDGMDFEEVVKLHGSLPIAAACEAICQAAQGLQAVHEQGLVHRDIKPSNLMLTRKGAVKLLDLGLARLYDEPAEGANVTGIGQIMGTADYMAPEQVTDCHSVDIRADIYSLGCTLYKLLTGEVVFPSSQYSGPMEKLAAQCLKAAPPIRPLREEVPVALAEVVTRALAKKAEDRFATPAEMAEALRPFAAGADLAALCAKDTFSIATLRPATTDRGSASRTLFSRRTLVVGIACATVLVALAAIFGSLARRHGNGGAAGPGVAAKDSATGEGPSAAIAPPPPPMLPSLDAVRARKFQAEYAAALKIPVAQTNSLGMSLALIPPSDFIMGTTKAESEGLRSAEQLSERAPHKVTISQPFLLSACEVTQDAYRQVMHVNPSHFSAQGDGRKKVGGHSTDQYPVESVSWSDAEEFCHKLSARQEERAAQRNYRLPTEAEWEYACRAGTTSRWYSGDKESDLDQCAWLRANAEESTHAIGTKWPNAWGLYDMHGNVLEWCNDWFSPEYYQHSPAEDPQGPNTGVERVIRGGSWWNLPVDARSAARVGSPADGGMTIGFRVACDIPLRPAVIKAAKPKPTAKSK